MPAQDELNKVNPGPFGSTVTNFSAVSKVGKNPTDVAGDKDFTNPDVGESSGSTMFGEGSIGKVRYAGLAYLLQQEGSMDLQINAGEFFAQPKVGEFLERKYPKKGTDLQKEITKLFSADSSAATLADLTTHRSGIGDLTKDQAKLIAEKGIEHPFFSPETIGLMMKEGGKFLSCGVNNSPDQTRKGNDLFQAPGFVFEVGKESGKPITFEKSGNSFGYASFLNVDAKTGEAKIDMRASENITGEIAKTSGLEVAALIEKYRDPESGKFDRGKMIEEKMPEVAQGIAIKNTLTALQDNGASTGDADSPTAQSNIQRVDGNFASK